MKEKRQRHRVFPLTGISCLFFSFFLFQAEKPSPEPYLLAYPSNFGNRYKIPENNPMTKEGVALGRLLFYEPLLSKDNQVSCSSCHQQALAFTDGKPLSEGVDGHKTQRNSMSLANVLWVRNLFWDGRVGSLEQQALFPLTDPHEMSQPLNESVKKLESTKLYPDQFQRAFGSADITAEGIVNALAQFQRTLISANSPYDRYLSGDYDPTPQEKRGMDLFMTFPQPEKNIRGANCAHCHGSPKAFKELFHDNGLELFVLDSGRIGFTGKEVDKGRFRVPTLRNIALTAPYMHDGRFETLEEVLNHYSDHVQNNPNLSPFIGNVSNEAGQIGLKLTKVEKEDIIAFLNMLTDSTFIQNPAFSNPHLATKIK